MHSRLKISEAAPSLVNWPCLRSERSDGKMPTAVSAFTVRCGFLTVNGENFAPRLSNSGALTVSRKNAATRILRIKTEKSAEATPFGCVRWTGTENRLQLECTFADGMSRDHLIRKRRTIHQRATRVFWSSSDVATNIK